MTVLLAIDPSTRTAGWAVFLTDNPEISLCTPSGTAEGASNHAQNNHVSHAENPPGGTCPHRDWKLVETGVIIAYDRSHRSDIERRIAAIEEALDNTVDRWQPLVACYGKPPQLQLPQQQEGMEILRESLERWAGEHGLPIYCYPIREIRSALVGRPNGAKEELVYSVMTRWGLLGEGKTTQEWNAIAVGDCHLGRQVAPALESKA